MKVHALIGERELDMYTDGAVPGRLHVNPKVIHVDLKPLFSNHVSEDVIHKHLESGWGIAETKEHDCWLKKTKGGNKSGFSLVFLVDVDVVITPSDIELSEECGLLHVVN